MICLICWNCGWFLRNSRGLAGSHREPASPPCHGLAETPHFCRGATAAMTRDSPSHT
uniref:Uncharacterized protein n=1 Tax=Anguilla anguilla TaxID=7936 RepID=A0A0E9PHP7_ANGAN